MDTALFIELAILVIGAGYFWAEENALHYTNDDGDVLTYYDGIWELNGNPGLSPFALAYRVL